MVRLPSRNGHVSGSICKRRTGTYREIRYKTVDDHSIKADILFPPGLQPGRHPLLLAIHGGYLITGARDYYRSISAWVPAYSASTSAIVVSPDYRLFPGAKTSDILSDLEDFWQWVQNDLPLVLNDLAPEYSIDLDRVLVHGTSAGGFCAAHIAMDHPESIRAAIMTYPMLDCLDAYMTEGPPSDIAATAPYQGQDLCEKIEAARMEGWVSGRRDEESLLLTRSIMKQGYFGQLFGTDKRWNPLQKLQYTKGCLPRT